MFQIHFVSKFKANSILSTSNRIQYLCTQSQIQNERKQELLTKNYSIFENIQISKKYSHDINNNLLNIRQFMNYTKQNEITNFESFYILRSYSKSFSQNKNTEIPKKSHINTNEHIKNHLNHSKKTDASNSDKSQINNYNTKKNMSQSNFDQDGHDKHDNQQPATRFIVYNVDWTKKNEVLKAFLEYGQCEIFTPNFNTDPEKDKGRIYLLFKNPEEAATSMRELQLVKFGDRHIRITPFGKRVIENLERVRGNRFEPSIKGKPTLVVKMIPYSMDEEAMRILFSQWGTVLETVIARSANGMSRGFGMVVFEDMESYTSAFEQSQGIELEKGISMKLEPYEESKKKEKYDQLRKNGIAKVSNRQII